jgi:hypothetical protein
MASNPLRFLLRFAGLSILMFAGWGLFPLAFDFVTGDLSRLLNWESMRFRFVHDLDRAEPFLLLCLGGGILYVLAGLSMPLGPSRRGSRPARFDFNAAFGPYLIYEPFTKRMLKCLKGILLILTGTGLAGLLYVVGHDLPLIVRSHKGEPVPELAILGVVLELVPVIPAGVLVFFGLRHFARGAERSLRGDRRPPFLYLRSFKADGGRLGDEEGPFRKFVRFLSGSRYVSYEECLVKAVADIAPVVAIGKPGEKLPPLGAARVYVRDDWQKVVTELVAASRAVFLRIGYTEGFWWEIEHVVANCDPRKVIICLPWRRGREMYAHLRRRGADVFPRPLSPSPGDATFLTFDSEWNPRLLPTTFDDIAFRKNMYWSAQPDRQSSPFRLLRRIWIWRVRAMRHALNDALEKLGIARRPMPLTLGEFIVLNIIIFLAVLWSRSW